MVRPCSGQTQNGSHRRAVWSSVTQLSMELDFGATLQGRAVLLESRSGKRLSSQRYIQLFSHKHGYEEKKGSPLQKRADFQNYPPRGPFWISFFLSVPLPDHFGLRHQMKLVLKIQNKNRTFRTEVTDTALSSCQNENLKIKQILFTYKEDTFKTSLLAAIIKTWKSCFPICPGEKSLFEGWG